MAHNKLPTEYNIDYICRVDNCQILLPHYHCPVEDCHYVYQIINDNKYQVRLTEHVHCSYVCPKTGTPCYNTQYHIHCQYIDEFGEMCINNSPHVHCQECENQQIIGDWEESPHYHCDTCQEPVKIGDLHGHCIYCEKKYSSPHRFCANCQKCLEGNLTKTHDYCKICMKCFDRDHFHCKF